jgi:hypothetical protein
MVSFTACAKPFPTFRTSIPFTQKPFCDFHVFLLFVAGTFQCKPFREYYFFVPFTSTAMLRNPVNVTTQCHYSK